MTTADLIRNRFEKLHAEFGSVVTPEPSKIRIEVPLKNGVGQYEFNLKKIIDNEREQGLDRNDVFVPNFLGVLCGFQNVDAETPQTMSLYPYAPYYSGVKSVSKEGFTNDNANALYNGKFTMQIDNTIILNAYPTENFKKVPVEQGCVIYNGEELVNMDVQPEFSIQDACELMIPRILIAGTRDIKIRVNFNAAGLTFPCDNENGDVLQPVLVLYMDGFLMKNGCEKGIGVGEKVSQVVGSW